MGLTRCYKTEVFYIYIYLLALFIHNDYVEWSTWGVEQFLYNSWACAYLCRGFT